MTIGSNSAARRGEGKYGAWGSPTREEGMREWPGSTVDVTRTVNEGGAAKTGRSASWVRLGRGLACEPAWPRPNSDVVCIGCGLAGLGVGAAGA